MSGDPGSQDTPRPREPGDPGVRGEDAPAAEPEPTPEPEPRRHRVRLSYRAADRSMMADQVLILMALVVAAFMVYSRGCRSSLDGLTKVLTEEAPPAGAGGEDVDGSTAKERQRD